MSILFTGSFQNETEPYWARAGQGGSGGVGPNLQVSTLVTNAEGFVALQATGTINALNSAPLAFDRTSDAIDPTPTLISIAANVPNGGGPPTENVSVLNNTKTFYDPLSVGELNVYGNNGVFNTAGSVGVIGQFGATTDMQITTSGLHTSSFFVSSINGGAYPPGDLGPNPSFSTVTINQQGEVILRATGDIDTLSTSKITFEKTTDISLAPDELQMTTNLLGNIAGSSKYEAIAITTPYLGQKYYDALALGNLIVYPNNAPSTDPTGQVAVIQQYSTTTDVEVLTTGFHTSNLIVSSINGVSPGGGGSSGPDILVSTVTVNSEGKITMTASGTSNVPVTAQIEFATTPDIPGVYKPTNLAMEATNTISALGIPFISEQVALTGRSFNPFVPQTVYRPLAVGNLLVYGINNFVTSTIGQLASFEEWAVGSTDVSCRTTGFHTSNIFASTLAASTITCDSINSTQPLLVSTINTLTVDASLVKASTFSLFNNAPVDLGGLNLGLGEFLGNYTGAFAGQTLAMTLAGSAVGISLVGAIAPRLEGNITPPGEVSTFQTINLQTQLQYSTIGSQVSSFYRFVSSSDGLGGTVTPGKEYIVSSIIAPGTTCIRSFSDPINLANPSTYTSTVQSFGYWVPVPQQATLPFSTVNGDFVVQSTLTAYKENISTTLNVVGALTAGNIASQGIVTAATNITAGGTIQAGGNLIVAGTGNVTGTFTAGLVATNTLNTTALTALGTANINILNANYISTATLNALTIIGCNANIPQLTGISSINGLPYVAGGGSGGTLGVFSTLIVSSMTTTSSLTVTAVTNTSTINTNSVSTFTAKANNITTGSVRLGLVGSPTILDIDGSINNPIQGSIRFSTGQFSTLTTSTLTTRSVNANTISTQELFISTVNGITYPPPFNSTIIGNLIVTSTLTAQEVFAQGNITTPGNIGASGNITGVIGTFTSIADAGALSVGGGANITGLTNITGDLRASGSGVIGGVGLGPVVVGRNSGDIYGRDIKVSSITTSENSIFNANININSGALFTNQIYMLGGAIDNLKAITSLSSINGVVYPPFIPTQSTFNEIYTSSIQASTVTASVRVIAPEIVCLGNISTTSINLPQINIGVIAGQISSATMKSLSSDTINLKAVAGGMSSLTVSTINNLPYPPNGGANSVFSTIVVSSTATVLGGLSAAGGNVGGVIFSGGGVASGGIITANTLNANIGINSVQFLSTPIVNATNYVSTPTVNATTSMTTRVLATSTMTANVVTFNDAPIPDVNGIFGGASFEMFISSSIVAGNPRDYTHIFPGLAQFVGIGPDNTLISKAQVTTAGINGFGNTIFTSLLGDHIQVTENISTTSAVLRQTQIYPGQVLIGVSTSTDIALTTNGSVNISGNLRVLGALSTSQFYTGSLTAFQINTQSNNVQFQMGSEANTGINKFGPNPAGVGLAQLVTGCKYQTGQYNYGASFAFAVNTPVPMPNTYFSCLYPCSVDVIVQSFTNGGSLGTQNSQTMAGQFKVFFGLKDALTLGGAYQDATNVTNFYQNNCFLVAVPVVGVASAYYIAPFTNINNGHPPTNVCISWKVQPVFELNAP